MESSKPRGVRLEHLHAVVEGKPVTAAKGAGPGKPAIGARCYESHPPYEIVEGIVIYGGSGITPAVEDADVYVSFESTGPVKPRPPAPWNPGSLKEPERWCYPIINNGVPANMDEFCRLIAWLVSQLRAGKKVHIGCIGGHGRTGLVLAVLRRYLADDPRAGHHVRDNYCHRAIESSEQVAWLEKFFDIDPVKVTGSSFGSSKSTKPRDSFGLLPGEKRPGGISYQDFQSRLNDNDDDQTTDDDDPGEMLPKKEKKKARKARTGT